MKKKTIALGALALALALLLGLAALLQGAGFGDESSSIPTIQLVDASAAQFTALEWQRSGGEVLKVERVELPASSDSADSALVSATFVWQSSGDAAFQMDAAQGDAMASALSMLTAQRDLGSQTDLSAFGLDAPRLTVTARWEGGSTTLLVGDANETTGDVYVKVEGIDSVYTVASDFVETFPERKEALRQEEEPAEGASPGGEAASSQASPAGGESSSGSSAPPSDGSGSQAERNSGGGADSGSSGSASASSENASSASASSDSNSGSESSAG